MKKSFKRFLSGALATVMAVAGMTIGMTTTASADETVYKYTNTPAENTNSYFTIAGSKKTGQDETFTPEGESASATYSPLKMDGNGKITFKTGDAATITVYVKSDGSNRKLSICGNEIVVPSTLTPYTYSLNAATDYTIVRTSGESWVYYVKVVEGSADGPTVYWPTADSQTNASSSWVGGEPTNLLTANKVANGAVNNGGDDSNKNRIRIGVAGNTKNNPDGAEPTIESCGYITFTQKDSFVVSIKAASSGAESTRTFYLGTYENGTFTDIKELSVTGNTGETVTVEVTAEGEHTYAVYVKPYDKGNDGTLDPAENTDIMQIDVAPATAVYATVPTVTLGDATVEDGKLTVTGTFNDFTKDVYEVQSITLNAAHGKDTKDAAVWTENKITNIKDNGDGTVSFTAVADDISEDARFQAVAEYKGMVEAVKDLVAKAVSNVATFTAE